MGDVVHALPAAAALRQRWPAATIDWVVDPRWAPLLVDATGRGPVVSGVVFAETQLWSRAPVSPATMRSILGLRRALRAGRYTHVVDMQGTLRSSVIGRMAGGEEFAGFEDPRERAAAWLYRRKFARRGTHVVEQDAALLGHALGDGLGDTAGDPLEPVAAELPIRAEAEAWAAQLWAEWDLPGRVALLAPTAGWGAKQWPAERFGQLALALEAKGFAVLINAASESDRVAAEGVQASEGAAWRVVCDPAQLVALTRRAAVVVGGDTGPVHLAAALGRPVVALFGPTDPERNGPWGPGPKRVLRDAGSVTSYKRNAEVEAGLARIEVAAVAEAVRAVVGS